MKHVVCFHLFDDYSGSPKVLASLLDSLSDTVSIDIVTSDTDGVLSRLEGLGNIRIHTYSYSFSTNKLIRLLRYLYVQFRTFFLAFRFRNADTFYINTLLPICPALAGRILGRNVICHCHENPHSLGVGYRILFGLMKTVADRIICVSAYQASHLNTPKAIVVPNSLAPSFLVSLKPDALKAFRNKNVLMLASLKDYKGVPEFISLSTMLPQYEFLLVLNESQNEIDEYIEHHKFVLASNIHIFPRQADVVTFYNSCSLVLNLTDRRKVVETFGLSVLEAVSCGLPVIVPTEGGPVEMVIDGVNGYRIDVHDLDLISVGIDRILSDESLYVSMSNESLKIASKFNNVKPSEIIRELI